MARGALRLGISACFFHADSQRPVFKGKTLLYIEQSLSHWLMSTGALAVMLPTAPSPQQSHELVENIDGLVLHGGADVSPTAYGETPLRPEWAGDAVRDAYEMNLLRRCIDLNKPILGVCRGAQLINVALGGSLYQDIQTQRADSRLHRDWNVYDQLFHPISLIKGGFLASLYAGREEVRVNSVHHQAVRKLGQGLVAEALSEDGVIEAVRWVDSPAYVLGVQWHPEYHDASDPALLSSRPLLDNFLQAVEQRR